MNYRNKISYLLIAIFIVNIFFVSCSTQLEKIPITTNSEEAKKLYLKGLSLSDRLRGLEAVTYFQEAITLDSNFAMAYIGLAFANQNPNDFFTNIAKATSLKKYVSKGEQIWISAAEAQINNQNDATRSFLEELLLLYPNDERVLNFMATTYFVSQEYEKSIKYYLKALEINPKYSPVYNQLGYAYRFLQNYNEAEKMFEKYIKLIPNDPNPYDSYGELLLKMGKFDKSIANYEKALQVNPYFTFSYLGIASNLNYKNEHVQARNQLQKLLKSATNDITKRIAYEGIIVSYIDEGNLAAALKVTGKMKQLSINSADTIRIVNELINLGFLYIAMDKVNDAEKSFLSSQELIENSSLSSQIQYNASKNNLINFAILDIIKNKSTNAHNKIDEFFEYATSQNNPNLVRLGNQLYAMLAYQEGKYQSAIDYFRRSNQNNPFNIYRMALAYEKIGDNEKAQSYFQKAANANLVSNRNYSYIRKKALEKIQNK